MLSLWHNAGYHHQWRLINRVAVKCPCISKALGLFLQLMFLPKASSHVPHDRYMAWPFWKHLFLLLFKRSFHHDVFTAIFYFSWLLGAAWERFLLNLQGKLNLPLWWQPSTLTPALPYKAQSRHELPSDAEKLSWSSLMGYILSEWCFFFPLFM